ncbi:hypothetical protein [Rossellomorea marisflavi]|uniref:hypothetical protein n=1 Tax=Rossellomorea marisflavi TaxID=189381 RepID=UPI00345E01E7
MNGESSYDKIRELVQQYCSMADAFVDEYDQGFIHGVTETLNILEIKIEGVND